MKVRLLNPNDKGGDIFAEGTVKVVPKRDHTVAVLPLIKPGTPWKVWKTWDIEIEAKGCEIISFP